MRAPWSRCRPAPPRLEVHLLRKCTYGSPRRRRQLDEQRRAECDALRAKGEEGRRRECEALLARLEELRTKMEEQRRQEANELRTKSPSLPPYCFPTV